MKARFSNATATHGRPRPNMKTNEQSFLHERMNIPDSEWTAVEDRKGTRCNGRDKYSGNRELELHLWGDYRANGNRCGL